MTARVLVAGGTGPLGRAIVRQVAARGAAVAVHHRTAVSEASALAADVGGVAVRADLLGEGEAERLVAAAEQGLGGALSAVINCAWPSHASAALGDADQCDLLGAAIGGVRAHLALCRAALPSLRTTQGAIVLLGGALATRRHPGLGYYSLGKAAATSASLTLALEEGRHGVRVNVVAPGRVDVGDGDLVERDPAFASLDEIGTRRRALPRLPTVDEVARVAAMLIGADGAGLTGQVLTVAGGEQV